MTRKYHHYNMLSVDKLEHELEQALRALHPMRMGNRWIICTTVQATNGGLYMCYILSDERIVHYRRVDRSDYANENFQPVNRIF